MKGLTDKQKQILDFIGQYGQEQGMAPTINEISEHFDVTAATAFAHVKALQKKGMLNRTSKARSISLPGAQHVAENVNAKSRHKSHADHRHTVGVGGKHEDEH